MARTRRIKPKALGWHWDQKEPFIHPENGRKSCRWCRGKVDPPRKSWCGKPECVREWTRRTDWSLTRRIVLERDDGICQLCRVDTRLLDLAFLDAQIYRSGLWHDRPELRSRLNVERVGGEVPRPGHWINLHAAALRWRIAHRIAPDRPASEVDHIVPVCEGGDWFDLANLQTLCAACHRAKTNELNARRRAKGERCTPTCPSSSSGSGGSRSRSRRSSTSSSRRAARRRGCT